MSISRVINICLLILVGCGCVGNANKSEAEDGLLGRVLSYWDEIDAVNIPADSLEQHVVDYLYLLGHIDSVGREKSWPGFFRGVREQPNRIAVEYLGESDSPLYSPAMLEEYLENLLRYSDDGAIGARASYLLENLRKNRPGKRISDLMVMAGGKQTSLHRLVDEAGKDCLIIFYDPDCDACDMAFARLEGKDMTGTQIIAVSVTGKAKVLDESWLSAIVVDRDEFEEKYRSAILPSVYLVSRDAIVIHNEAKFLDQ